jgi:histidinol phosphatase-like enzyme
MTTFLSIALTALMSNPFATTNATTNPTTVPATTQQLSNDEPTTAVTASINNAFAYPAKATEIVALSYSLNTNDASFIVITDKNGVVVGTMEETASTGKHTLIYDVAELAAGEYTCQITTKNVTKTVHFTRK